MLSMPYTHSPPPYLRSPNLLAQVIQVRRPRKNEYQKHEHQIYRELHLLDLVRVRQEIVHPHHELLRQVIARWCYVLQQVPKLVEISLVVY